MTQIQIPEKLDFLFRPSRFKVAYGGRAGAKSHGFAAALLVQGMQSTHRILCCREIQKSLDQSVYKLLSDKITTHDLGSFYDVQRTKIIGKNGTEIFFAGLQDHTVDSIKSFEGCSRVWVEEAHSVSKKSWNTLIPTIRAEGSEIWVSFNPELDTDEAYKMFVLSPPPNAIVVKIGWEDNPFVTDSTLQDIARVRAQDARLGEDEYRHIYGGEPRSAVVGAIFAKELARADMENRIRAVPYDASKPVFTFWDLGWGDATSIWFVQRVGLEYRALKYLEFRQTKLAEIVSAINAQGYAIKADCLPHDANNGSLAADGQTVANVLERLGRRVKIVPKLDLVAGIDAARSIFGSVWFDSTGCADGIKALRSYRYDQDRDGNTSRKPLHDDASHGADAFRYFASGLSLMEDHDAETLRKLIPLG